MSALCLLRPLEVEFKVPRGGQRGQEQAGWPMLLTAWRAPPGPDFKMAPRPAERVSLLGKCAPFPWPVFSGSY